MASFLCSGNVPFVVADLFRQVVSYYYDERICLLHCLGSLLRNGQDAEHPYYEQANECVDNMLKDGLTKKIVSQYEILADATVPKHMVP